MGLARISGTRSGSSRREGVLPKRPDLKRSANGPRSQRVRAGKLGQNAVRWSAFVPLRPGTSRAPALGQDAREKAPTAVAATAAEILEPPNVACYGPGAFQSARDVSGRGCRFWASLSHLFRRGAFPD